MTISYDKEIGALYLKFSSAKVHKTKRASEFFIVDLDKKGAVRGIEILDAKKGVSVRSVPSGATERKLSVSLGNKSVLVPNL